jgi:outer membrane receptor protein involved in Fe transport
MSKFEVTTTQGHGYVTTNAASGFKTNETLLDIPQVDTVITRDLITDLGYNSAAENLQYFGIANIYIGEQIALRGGRLITPYIDELPDMLPFADSSWYDSYEIIKGPS